ncbi:transmembrane ascorbate-dependent reductase CYB561 [Anabrus simplex]|uniref:transmembrane ascorbate-dependent reductase CYB561 n=1 Tax=Anabrus simplex TaxID=316456 RepID=UPI0034DCE85A
MDNQRPRPEGFSVVFALIELTGALTIILMTVWLGYYHGGFSWRSNPALEFNWHPVLMTIGMIFLYADSIMVYRAFPNNSKRNLKLTHAIIHVIAFILSVIGLQAVFDSHNLATPPTPNLYTLHSWIGLVAVILFCCQWMSGLVTFLFPGLKPGLRAVYLPVHVFFGLMGFVCSLVAALLGLLEKAHWAVKDYKDLPPEGLLVNFIGVILMVFGSLVVYLVTEPQFKRHPRPEDEILLTGNLE